MNNTGGVRAYRAELILLIIAFMQLSVSTHIPLHHFEVCVICHHIHNKCVCLVLPPSSVLTDSLLQDAPLVHNISLNICLSKQALSLSASLNGDPFCKVLIETIELLQYATFALKKMKLFSCYLLCVNECNYCYWHMACFCDLVRELALTAILTVSCFCSRFDFFGSV